jgi:hypothetical protein
VYYSVAGEKDTWNIAYRRFNNGKQAKARFKSLRSRVKRATPLSSEALISNLLYYVISERKVETKSVGLL